MTIKNKIFETQNFTLVYSDGYNYVTPIKNFITSRTGEKVYQFDDYYVVTGQKFIINFLDYPIPVTTGQGVYYCVFDVRRCDFVNINSHKHNQFNVKMQ